MQLDGASGPRRRHLIEGDGAERAAEPLVLLLALFSGLPFQQSGGEPFLCERLPRLNAAAVDGFDEAIEQRAKIRRRSS